MLKSKLTVMNDKDKSFVAEADLNLCDYKESDYYIQKLPLDKCDDKNAYIDFGLRATVYTVKSPRGTGAKNAASC